MRPSIALQTHRDAIRFELKKLLGIPVDVLTPRALPDSFKERVLKEAVPV